MFYSQPDDETGQDDTDISEPVVSSTDISLNVLTHASPRTCKNTPCMFMDPCE